MYSSCARAYNTYSEMENNERNLNVFTILVKVRVILVEKVIVKNVKQFTKNIPPNTLPSISIQNDTIWMFNNENM